MIYKYDTSWFWCTKCKWLNLTHALDHVKGGESNKTNNNNSSSIGNNTTTAGSSNVNANANINVAGIPPENTLASLNFAQLVLQRLQKGSDI